MDSATFFYNNAIRDVVGLLEAHDGIRAALSFKQACSRHSFSEEALLAAVRTHLAAAYGLKADRMVGTLNAGFSLSRWV